MRIKDALEAVENILKACRIISPGFQTHRIALELIKKHQLSSDKIFDAYLVATILSNDITTIATDNVKDFRRITEITILNPFKV